MTGPARVAMTVHRNVDDLPRDAVGGGDRRKLTSCATSWTSQPPPSGVFASVTTVDRRLWCHKRHAVGKRQARPDPVEPDIGFAIFVCGIAYQLLESCLRDWIGPEVGVRQVPGDR
jgi:hypothetical protein